MKKAAYGLQFLQGAYPWEMIVSLSPVYSSLFDSFIFSTLEQDG